MKRRHLLLVRGVFSLPILFSSLVAAADGVWSSDDRTESAYFLVTSEGSGIDALPLKESRVEIQVAGVIAQVRVTQVYRNQGPRPLEVYVFPGSTRAAVSALRMKVGDRTIEADVKERDAARRTYEAPREEGRTASLLEQQPPNVPDERRQHSSR